MENQPASGMTPIQQLGEFRLIERLTQGFSLRNPDVIRGVGDDAAAIRSAEGRAEVVSSDLLLEGVHFDLAYVPLRHLGYKSVAVNLSDIAAMNAQPYGIIVSIGASNRFPVEALEELYHGIRIACEHYQVDLLGGDTTSSRQGLVISITALGRAPEPALVYRGGAKPQDLICVSGNLGAAYAGLLVLEREKNVFLQSPHLQPELELYDYVVGRQLKPEARLDILARLAELGVQPTSMMDISDGLASELHHLCRASKVGATIYANKLPIDPQTVSVAEEFKLSPLTCALNGGEDYELIFTVPLPAFDALKAEREITIIGHMTPEAGLVQIVLENGELSDIPAQGWQHFSESSS